ncbi:MAG TPA: COX15/CtaA family protein [Vicinamibacteria bacterium]
MTAAPPHAPWRHRLALLTLGATLALIFIGGLVTSTGSGLSVPDWPLSYGMLMPPMVGGIFYEHGHRMAATAVGFLTLLLALWTARAEPRRGVRGLAFGALAAVVTQGILGGLTVIYLLPTPISVTHACLAQIFFCLVIALAYTTSREWASAAPVADDAGLRGVAMVTTFVVFIQLFLGAVMRHTGAGLAIPDFPLAFGRILPPLVDTGVVIHFSHRTFALVVAAAVATLALRARRTADPRFVRPAVLALVLTMVQIGLGAATVLMEKAVAPTTAHVATGAAILGTCFFIALRAFRLTVTRVQMAGVPAFPARRATV